MPVEDQFHIFEIAISELTKLVSTSFQCPKEVRIAVCIGIYNRAISYNDFVIYDIVTGKPILSA
jgi:hypothetical protein